MFWVHEHLGVVFLRLMRSEIPTLLRFHQTGEFSITGSRSPRVCFSLSASILERCHPSDLCPCKHSACFLYVLFSLLPTETAYVCPLPSRCVFLAEKHAEVKQIALSLCAALRLRCLSVLGSDGPFQQFVTVASAPAAPARGTHTYTHWLAQTERSSHLPPATGQQEVQQAGVGQGWFGTWITSGPSWTIKCVTGVSTVTEGSLSCSTSADLSVTVTTNDSGDQVSPTIPRASKNRVSGKLRRSASAISKSSN
ncbi:hypothetical protein QQF64_011627 [Cirrhinus molitorella]|uniref:Uncharacterized protein n=1 Tax=Cirrhinus molitorella TaxID=172907 RepID=A0ABR3LZT1_9TELE